MNEIQKKVYSLLENYLCYCENFGYTDFEVWCEDNIDSDQEMELAVQVYRAVNQIADKLFDMKK